MADHAEYEQVQEISIRDESIRLGQFLKLAGVVDSGFDAKNVIEQGDVFVNGEVETRRGKQLRDGDLVQCIDLISGEPVLLKVVSPNT